MKKSLQEFAKMVINDRKVRASLLRRARAGTLDPTIEMLFLELAEGRTPLSADGGELTSPHQSRSLALVRPSDFSTEGGND